MGVKITSLNATPYHLATISQATAITSTVVSTTTIQDEPMVAVTIGVSSPKDARGIKTRFSFN